MNTTTTTTKPMRRTIWRLAAPWGAVLVMTAGIVAASFRDPAPARAAEPRNDASSQPATAPSYPTIVRVVGRDITVTISGSGGVGHRDRAGRNLFSARRADGTILASNVTLDELRVNHPAVYRQIQPALANATYADASARSTSAWAGAE